METFRLQRLYAPRFKFNVQKNTTLDFWNTTLPDGIDQVMVEEIGLLNRLGYHPNKLTAEQYDQLGITLQLTVIARDLASSNRHLN